MVNITINWVISFTHWVHPFKVYAEGMSGAGISFNWLNGTIINTFDLTGFYSNSYSNEAHRSRIFCIGY